MLKLNWSFLQVVHAPAHIRSRTVHSASVTFSQRATHVLLKVVVQFGGSGSSS